MVGIISVSLVMLIVVVKLAVKKVIEDVLKVKVV